MEGKTKIQGALKPVAMSLVAGVLVVGLAQIAGAYASAGTGRSSNGETCAFTLQLLSSVSLRRQYMVKVDQVTGGSDVAGNTVEGMYGNIQPAAYSPEADADEPEDTGTISMIISYATKANTTARNMNTTQATLDSFSADCISCHDGVSASSIGVDLRDRPFNRRSTVSSFKSDHPIGMNYNNYVAGSRSFKPVGMNSKMVFVNGRVGCLTCHDPLNEEKGHLVMSDRNSALCKSCHDK